jgi:hypothetical protein
MSKNFMRSRQRVAVWAVAWSVILFSAAACGPDGSAGPNGTDLVSDPAAPPDTVLVADSLAPADSLTPTDSLAPDSLSPTTPDAAILSVYRGIPFGPYNLFNGYTTVAWGPAPFTASLNGNTDPNGVIRQIDAARTMKHRLMLSLTDGPRSLQITNGKFDLAKWKRRMDGYRTSAIRAAVARGLADGTIIGNNIMNEPKHAQWGGVVNKAVLDQMCSYVKGVFPGLPSGPITVHWWRPTERYRVCDFIIDQYDYEQPPLGWGTPGGKGNVTGWRDAALAQARKEGIVIAFAMNVLDGGPQLAGCPLSSTGGYGTYAGHCRMTATQVRNFGRALGPSGCALHLWMYNQAFMSKSTNIQAFKDVAATLAVAAPRSCRRPTI